MYNFSDNYLNPPQDRIFGRCEHCRGEIYEGDYIYEIDGIFVHEDCLEDYVRDNIATKMEANSDRYYGDND